MYNFLIKVDALCFVDSNHVETGCILCQHHLYDGRAPADSPLNGGYEMISDNLYFRLEKLEAHMNYTEV